MHWHWTNKFDTGEIRSSRKQPWSFHQMIRSLGAISIWLFGLGFLFAGVNINEPYLISLRGLGAAALFISSIVVLIFLIKRGSWARYRGKIADLAVVPAIIVDVVRS